MALGANTKRALRVALAAHGEGAALAAAVDANTLKTSMPTVASVTTTTTNATTTWIHTQFKATIASLKAGGHMA